MTTCLHMRRRKTDAIAKGRTWHCCGHYFFSTSGYCRVCKHHILPAALPMYARALTFDDMQGWRELPGGGRVRINHI